MLKRKNKAIVGLIIQTVRFDKGVKALLISLAYLSIMTAESIESKRPALRIAAALVLL